jgi:hypothetical protein
MTEFKFHPPITMKDGVIVCTLDDAAAFVRSYKDAHRPLMQENVLRRLEGAASADALRDAATTFRGWAESENVVQH